MAKRKRLTPAQPEQFHDKARAETRPGLTAAAPAAPIARVAQDAVSTAALRELSEEMRAARDEGRLIQRLPLAAVEADYLVRDRLAVNDEELASLKQSLAARGQQVPIEVTALAEDRFGLISGWRRLTALKALLDETGEARFATVLAHLRRPDSAAEAYLAMVEENEIRLGLSYYERARIVAKATDAGVFPSEAMALKTLFASASRARRSKIGAFLTIHRELDAFLSFPEAIPERLGLALAQAMSSDALIPGRLRDRLRKASTPTAEVEIEVLGRAVRQLAAPAAKPVKKGGGAAQTEPLPGVILGATKGGLSLTGPGVTEAFRRDLLAWLGTRRR